MDRARQRRAARVFLTAIGLFLLVAAVARERKSIGLWGGIAFVFGVWLALSLALAIASRKRRDRERRVRILTRAKWVVLIVGTLIAGQVVAILLKWASPLVRLGVWGLASAGVLELLFLGS